MAIKEPTKEKDWLKNTFDSIANIHNTSYDLQDLAQAFYATGNNHMAETLKAMAKHLTASAETISASVATAINEQFKASEQSSRNMLNAALGGVELASKK